MATTDIEIRRALHEIELTEYHACKNTAVIDELALLEGKCRIDIAVLNGCIHGYEIKSSKDTLSRFPSQLSAYIQCFEKLTVVAAPKHITKLEALLPGWCGMIVAEKDAAGNLTFETLRASSANPSADVKAMAHFLWKREAVEMLQRLGVDSALLKQRKSVLFEMIAQMVSVPEISDWIRSRVISREDWRADLPLL